jgi:hypothetical protein
MKISARCQICMGLHIKCLFSLSIFNQIWFSILDLIKKFPVWNLPKFSHTDQHDIANTVCVLRDTQYKQWLWFQASYSGDAAHTTYTGDSLHFLWSRNWSFGATRWHSWLRHCATSQKVVDSILDIVIGFFHGHYPSGRTMALGDLVFNRNEYQEYFLELKAAGA